MFVARVRGLLKLSPTARVSLGLAGLLVSLLVVLALLGLFPNTRQEALRQRIVFSDAAAVGFAMMADRLDTQTMREYIETVAKRNDDVVSMAIRGVDGNLIIEVGEHAALWNTIEQGNSTETEVSVPLFSEGKPWGTVEVCFRPLEQSKLASYLGGPASRHGAVLTMLCLIVFYFYLRSVLNQLNPSKVIPQRVREALDTLAEGLLVLDDSERIVLANRAFEQVTGTARESLYGVSISRLPLVSCDEVNRPNPWTEARAVGKPVRGRLFGMRCAEDTDYTFSVSASPIVDELGKCRGVLASLEDVTVLERKKRDLKSMVEHLRLSSDAIKYQNRELERLATLDPLTICLNRRAFFDRLEKEWKRAERYGHPMSAIMVDVDHFKSVNDKYGHAMGDEVLRDVGRCLREVVRDADLVCRYGGEEFTVLMPHTAMDEAHAGAERIRLAIAKLRFGELAITVSVGVSSLSEQPRNPQDLLGQADKCLYVAKRQGRNRAIRFDKAPVDLDSVETVGPYDDENAQDELAPIPFHAVNALVTALAYRDLTTAEHSRRVADLCFATAEGLLSYSECYRLEIAALLHDIGKIGVPDHILLKPSSLTEEEWSVMRQHDLMGAEIVRASFGSKFLADIIANYPAHYGTIDGGKSIPLGARILAIADAFDAMVTDQVYRQGRSRNEAFDELRRCGGDQFDPELVERFISVVRNQQSSCRLPIGGTSREIALMIGPQIQRLVAAIDSNNLDLLSVMSTRLRAIAQKQGALEIAEKVSELSVIIETDVDAHGIFRVANELLELCRSTQAAILRLAESHHRQSAIAEPSASECPADAGELTYALPAPIDAGPAAQAEHPSC